MLLVSCTGTQAVDLSPTIENIPTTWMEIISTKVSTFTETPTITPDLTPSPTSTPVATLTPAPTTDRFGSSCPIFREISHEAKISPDGKWMAARYYGESESPDPPLRVVNMDCSKDWKIYYHDYIGGDYGSKTLIDPYHWSKDGKFLYVGSGSIASGCCWLGIRTILLVRLDLETGQQLELLNGGFDFKISDSDRYLMFTPPAYQPYDFAILDLQTMKTQEVFLKFSKDIDLIYATMSPDDDKIVLPLFQQVESNDFEVVSIGIIDRKTNEQKVLISGLKRGNELFPLRWVDANHVLVSDTDPDAGEIYQADAKFWLLNIDSTKLTETQRP
jgi:hypothetical protein